MRDNSRRLGIHLAWLILAKIALLTGIYFICFRPFPRPDASPAHVLERIAPNSPAGDDSHD